MADKMQLTSVKIPESLFEEFKIACVKHKFSIQKLTERSMYLYMTNPEFKKEIHWKNIRTQYLAQKCRKICELIRNYVDYDSAYARVKLMRSVINGERAKLQSEGGLSARQIKSKISKKARDALFNCKVQPWNETVDLRDYQVGGGENPFYSIVRS